MGRPNGETLQEGREGEWALDTPEHSLTGWEMRRLGAIQGTANRRIRIARWSKFPSLSPGAWQ